MVDGWLLLCNDQTHLIPPILTYVRVRAMLVYEFTTLHSSLFYALRAY